ncbi:hypothetical protein DFP72DRAFT_825734 [Ephemerocybe angulata]|uniref:Uncharacterized protein n=1 Tax=Ephemerocybe angulata TaxID=980116 RepID=A0A8H6HCG0_9AGAR|nr:hypothetical protein DFP72DRAFT_825734 [Tulosesus angulatus]
MSKSLCFLKCSVTNIPLVLHPEYKLQYFVENSWPEDWIAQARSLVTNEWKNYKPRSTSASVPDIASNGAESGSQDRSAPSLGDALEEYLSTTPLVLDDAIDVIGYWARIKENGKTPGQRALAQMALDFLSVPGKFSS